MVSVQLCSDFLMTFSVCICPRDDSTFLFSTDSVTPLELCCLRLQIQVINTFNVKRLVSMNQVNKSISSPLMPPLRLSTSFVLPALSCSPDDGSGWQCLSDQQHAGAGGHTQITTLMSERCPS